MSRLIRRLSSASLSSITALGGSTNGAPLPGVVGSVAPMAIPAGADPQACFEVFCSHWAQIKGIIVKQNASGGRFPRTKASFDDIQAVANYATQMMYLLVEETQPLEGVMGRMLELTIEENVMDQLLSWGLKCGENVEDMKRELLRIYEMMLAQAKQAVLMHNALLNPLLRLLIACSEYCSDRVELHLVLLLHQLCVSLSKDPMLLEYLFHASPSQGPAKFLLFSLLIPFLHRDGKVGQQARDALLLCISVSSRGSNIAKYISESTNLCPVLATGLGALYSRLPRKLDIRVDHWHCLTREDWTVIPELCMFLHSLEFCNAVVQVAHPMVSNQLIQYFHDGFLVPVIGPALHQNPQDEIVAATAYVNLFLTSITAPPLMKGFLHYLCMGQHEGRLVLESLLSRISTNSRLCLVTLSLFDTLVNLNCEDFMLELILRYLVPCNHLMVSQRKAIREVDLHSKSADRFLLLRPACCRSKPASEKPKVVTVAAAASNASRLSNGDSSPEKKQVRLTLPSRVWNNRGKGQSAKNRQADAAVPKQQAPSQAADQLPSSDGQPTEQSLEDFETSQVEYLLDAKEGIRACSNGTLNWSAPYDGLNPPPESLSPDNLSPAYERKRSSSTFDMSTNAPSSASFAILAADEDTGLSSTYKSYSAVEFLPRPRDRKRNVDPKLTATIQEVLSLKIGTDCESVDTSDVNITDLFMDEKEQLEQSAVNGGSPQNEDRSSSKNVEIRPMANGDATLAELKGSRNHTSEPQQCVDKKLSLENTRESIPVANGPVGQTKSSGNLHTTEPNQSEDIVSELSTPESRVSSGKSRPKDLNITGPCKPSQESDSAFSGSNSPVLDCNYNGGSSIPQVNPVGSSQKGSQVANWLQALGEDTDSANFIETLSDDQKKRKRLSLIRPESERDGDEPCVFWEFDSDIEFSPKAVLSKMATSGGNGIENEADQILHALGFNVPKGANHQTNSSGRAYRNALNSEASEASTIDTLNSSMNENHFSMLNSSLHSDRNLNASGLSNQSLNRSLRSQSSPVQGNASRSLYTPIGRAIGIPTTGPFMDAIFARLDTMMQNSFYVNLLLTGIVARLAYYPQPLIRSYLLNTSMVFQPSVRSLIQVLTTIRNNLDAYAATIPEFENLLVRAKEYLFLREDGDSVYKGRSLVESEELAKTTRQRSGSLKSSATRKSTPLDLFLRRGSRRNKSISAAEKQKLSRINEAGMGLPAASAEYQSLKTRNAVYCTVIFDEFLKELAAISQEHAVAFSEQELGLR